MGEDGIVGSLLLIWREDAFGNSDEFTTLWSREWALTIPLLSGDTGDDGLSNDTRCWGVSLEELLVLDAMSGVRCCSELLCPLVS